MERALEHWKMRVRRQWRCSGSWQWRGPFIGAWRGRIKTTIPNQCSESVSGVGGYGTCERRQPDATR
jgi:hypothetical protein